MTTSEKHQDAHGRVRRTAVPVDRRHRILERVAEEQTIHVGDLARELGVSEMTVRRDIRRLERDGFLRQTYGGATAHVTRSLDLAFNARALTHAREKRLIGMRAAQLTLGATTIYIGIGTTTEQFAHYLRTGPEATVVTSSLVIASLLGTRPVRTVVAGGAVRRDDLSLTGSIVLSTLARYRFDLAVIGAAGLSARWGLTELADDEADVQRTVIERAERVMVLADASKLGTATNVVVAPAAAIDTLVTDPGAAPAEVQALAGLGVRIEIAGGARPAEGAAGALVAGNGAGIGAVAAAPRAGEGVVP